MKVSTRRSREILASMRIIWREPLLLVVILFGFMGALYVSVALSHQRDQIEKLIEEVAMLEARLREEVEALARGKRPP